MSDNTWRAKRSLSIDLEHDSSFAITKGQTYTDDGTTGFGDYICDELFEPASPVPGTIVVSNPDTRRSRKN
jgi:hypothetical protein